MPISATTVWEVRTTGNDTNGGGYSSGGTDWSQQDSPQYSVTDGVTDGTTTITSATAAFGTDVVGNVMYVVGGTGSVVAGWYQIISRTNATTIVVDRSTGLTAGTGVTLKIGGALATLSRACGQTANGNLVYTRAAETLTANVVLASASRIVGYTTTRGDNIKPTLTAAAGCTIMISLTSFGAMVSHLDLDGADIATHCVSGGSSEQCAIGLKARRFATIGINITGSGSLASYCEVTAGKSGATSGINVGAGRVISCNVYSNPCTGIVMGNWSSAVYCLVSGNTGASSDGISCSYSYVLRNNTVRGNGRDGFRTTNEYRSASELRNNIFYGNGGFGCNLTTGSTYPGLVVNAGNNAFGSNTSGARNNLPTESTDVALTADPFVNTAGGNFALNNTAGGGAALRAVGIPGVFPAGLTTGYMDIGAVQHQDSASGGGILTGRNWTGGYNG